MAYYGLYSIKTDCPSVRASVPSISNAFSLATAGPILPNIGTKVGTNSGFMNPENQEDRSHGLDFILQKELSVCVYACVCPVSDDFFSATVKPIAISVSPSLCFVSSTNFLAIEPIV